MKQDFSEVVDVGAAPAAAWSTVEDIANVLSWISIVDDVATIEPGSRYTAVLQDKLGPFKLPLPEWLTPGELTVTHTDLGAGAFRFTLDVIHPSYGRLVRQSAVFKEAAS